MIGEADIRGFLREKVKIDKTREEILLEKERIGYRDKRVTLIAIGKASHRMAEFFLAEMDDRVDETIIVLPKNAPASRPERGIRILRTGHPVPDENSLAAGELILEKAERMSEKDLAIYLISGGGSALAEKPVNGVGLDDLVITTRLLLNSGANIREINTVRKHLSLIKGGRLAEKTYPALSVTLMASDVPGDRPEDIASGPTVPDPTTYSDALEIIRFYRLEEKLPENVREILRKGAEGKIPETPKPGNPVFQRTYSYVVATPGLLLKRISKHLEKEGYSPIILTSSLTGESREIAKALASIATETYMGKNDIEPPAAILLAGEPSVTVMGRGRGGRALELVAWFSKELEENVRATIIALDTDGIDGNTPVAGGFADQATWGKAVKIHGGDALVMLRENDSYKLLDSIGHTLYTGYTGTNLNNIIVILVEKASVRVK